MANGADVPGVRQLGEALTVWAIYGLEAIAVLVTYSRLRARFSTTSTRPATWRVVSHEW